jgi:hypothetical protein
VPPKGGDGEDWLDVRPRRRKARRQGDRGQDWKLEANRFRDWDEEGDRQSRFKDSRLGYYESEAGYHQDRFSDRYGGESEDEWVRGNVRKRAGFSRQWSSVHVRGRNKEKRQADDGGGRTDAKLINAKNKAPANGPQLRRFVTFYFTNFPPQLSNFYLRKGFEVCGMLEEVVVPRRVNVYGEHYGFVRYSNVRDVCKLLKAVNAVCFGHFQIKAKVANFDKAAVAEVEKGAEGVGGGEVVSKVPLQDVGAKETDEGVIKVSKGIVKGGSMVEGEGDKSETVGLVKGGSVVLNRLEPVVGVKVGDVTVRLEKDRGKGSGLGGSKKVIGTIGAGKAQSEGQPSIQKLMRKYRSCEEDFLWARCGVIATVINGESIPVVQNRIADAGVEDIDIIPLGADQVFIRSNSEVNVTTILHDAKEFFDHFLLILCGGRRMLFRSNGVLG